MATKVLGVRLEPHLYKEIADAAKAKHLTLSEFARATLIRTARETLSNNDR